VPFISSIMPSNCLAWGALRLKERGYLPVEDVHILGVTVNERAGRWFVSVQVERDIPDPKATYKPVAGVDLGILALATVSDGTRIETHTPSRVACARSSDYNGWYPAGKWEVLIGRKRSGIWQGALCVANVRKECSATKVTACWREPSQQLCWKT